eukprot:1373263-Rhodomonas_salina.3
MTRYGRSTPKLTARKHNFWDKVEGDSVLGVQHTPSALRDRYAMSGAETVYAPLGGDGGLGKTLCASSLLCYGCPTQCPVLICTTRHPPMMSCTSSSCYAILGAGILVWSCLPPRPRRCPVTPVSLPLGEEASCRYLSPERDVTSQMRGVT